MKDKQFRPMLAADFDPEDAGSLRYPAIVQPKADGIRFLKLAPGRVVTRSLKPLRNDWLRDRIDEAVPPGFEGEIVVGDGFNDTTSAVMSAGGRPDATLYPFDRIDMPDEPTRSRLATLRDIPAEFPGGLTVEPLVGEFVHSADELLAFHRKMLSRGWEGTIVRDPDSRYKFGRSTRSEAALLRIKPWRDSEGVAIAALPRHKNENPARKDALGKTVRPTAKAKLVPQELLGSLVLSDPELGIVRVSNFSAPERVRLWRDRHSLCDVIVKYRYLPGVKNPVRHPQFVGFRSPDDMSRSEKMHCSMVHFSCFKN